MAGRAVSARDGRFARRPPSRTGECEGCEREGERNERYVVRFSTADGDKLECALADAERWRAFKPGSSYSAKKRVVGGDLDCDSLR